MFFFTASIQMKSNSFAICLVFFPDFSERCEKSFRKKIYHMNLTYFMGMTKRPRAIHAKIKILSHKTTMWNGPIFTSYAAISQFFGSSSHVIQLSSQLNLCLTHKKKNYAQLDTNVFALWLFQPNFNYRNKCNETIYFFYAFPCEWITFLKAYG